MRKRLLSGFLTIILVAGMFGGCSFEEKKETVQEETTVETTAPTEKVFVSYDALVTQGILVMREEPSLAAKPLCTLQAGEVVQVQDIVSVNGPMWASTDRGWVLAEYMQLRPDIPKVENTNATVVFNNAVVYSSRTVDAAVAGKMQAGERVLVTQVSHFGADAMACTEKGWIKLNQLLIDGCAASGRIPGVLNVRSADVYNGPGADYSVIGTISESDPLQIKGFYNSLSDRTPWAQLKDGRWIEAAQITFSEGITLLLGNNTDYKFYPQPAYVKPGTVQYKEYGTYIQYDIDEFHLTGTVKCDRITLNEDDTFYTTAGNDFDIYDYDIKRFYAAQDSCGEGGIYYFQGMGGTVVLQYDYIWYTGGREYYTIPRLEIRSFRAKNGNLTLGEDTWTRIEKYADGMAVLSRFLAGPPGGFINKAYAGSWTADTGETLHLGMYGDFVEKTADGKSYNNGTYMTQKAEDGEYIYLCSVGSALNPARIVYLKVDISDDRMTLTPVGAQPDDPVYVYTSAPE